MTIMKWMIRYIGLGLGTSIGFMIMTIMHGADENHDDSSGFESGWMSETICISHPGSDRIESNRCRRGFFDHEGA